jgi:GNAT superfamily N-acetyltransferase
MSADPKIFRTWVEGWAISRGTPPPVPVAHGFRVDVGLPAHRVRYVFPSLGPEIIRDLATSIEPPAAFIKVCCESEMMAPLLPANWRLETPGYMMTQSLRTDAPVSVPTGYDLVVERRGAVIVAELRDHRGDIAASGRVVLNGTSGIFDRIATHVDHRRRGLGTVVMRALGGEAIKEAIKSAILVATPDGRALYASLGWRLHSPYATAAIT